MRIDQAFRKSGFEIVDVKRGPDHMLIDVRIPLQNPVVPQRWKQMFDTVLRHAEEVMSKEKPKWELEIAKRFFARNSAIRYLWRIRIKGDLVVASAAIVAATIDALRTGNELTEVPLIGVSASVPQEGKFKGAYPRGEEDRASQRVAAAFTVGVG